MSPGARAIPFGEVAASSMARHDGGATLVVATDDAARATLARLVAELPATGSERVLVAAFQGEQRTGGYAIRITGIERDGDRLLVRAIFDEPPAGSMVTQVLTSPVHVVAIGRADAAGVRTGLLLDASGGERARVNVP